MAKGVNNDAKKRLKNRFREFMLDHINDPASPFWTRAMKGEAFDQTKARDYLTTVAERVSL